MPLYQQHCHVMGIFHQTDERANCHYMASISGNPLSDQYDLGSALVVPSQSKGPSTPQGSASNSRHCLPVRTRLSSVADNRAADSQAVGKQER